MKKVLFFTTMYLLTIATGWSEPISDDSRAIKQIFCLVKPIPSKNAFSTESTVYPNVRVRESTSVNWSGYAAATSLSHPGTGTVTKVSGTWIVPTITATSTKAYSAFWVGIDGFNNGTVEQIGTEQDWTGTGQSNYAWFEMYPRNSYEIVGFPVDQGDKISAKVVYKGKNVFQLSMTNHTKNVTTTIPSSYTKLKGAQRSSVEWIVEAPSNTNGVLPLADFGTGSFSGCTATINGITGPINSAHWMNDPLTMEQASIVKAVPSSLTGEGESFTVHWEHE